MNNLPLRAISQFKFGQRIIGILIVYFVLLSRMLLADDTNLGLGIHVEAPISPAFLKADGQGHLSYELHITNFRYEPVELTKIEVFAGSSGNTAVMTFNQSRLNSMTKVIGIKQQPPNKCLLNPGARVMVFLDVSMPSEKAPEQLNHQLSFRAELPKPEAFTLSAPRVSVNRTRPIVISPPLRGSGWVAVNAPWSASHHRQSVLPVDGQVRIPQRYAVDWVQLGENGLAIRGNPERTTNWHGYGAEILAVADGVVTRVRDGMSENTPFGPKPNVSFDDATGNSVIVKIDEQAFAVFGHIQPGTIRVKAGQRVRRGDVLGLLGNSGTSDVPHLHFHIINRDSPLFGDAIPYVIDSFIIEGSAESFDRMMTKPFHWPKSKRPNLRKKELPVNYMVIRFP